MEQNYYYYYFLQTKKNQIILDQFQNLIMVSLFQTLV